MQVAYHVVDVRSAAISWARERGAGPFVLAEHIPVSDVTYRGEPASFDHTSAYGQWGSVMVELVQQHDDVRSAVRDMFRATETGLHHVACFADDFDRASRNLVARGWEPATIATAGDLRFGFFDARQELGHMLEIYPRTAGLQAFYDAVAAAADPGGPDVFVDVTA